MKKLLYLAALAATTAMLTACSGEEEDLFKSSAAERLNSASEIYTARLTAQPNGWAMQYYPTYDDSDPNGAGYLLLCRFNKDMQVDISGYNWPLWTQEYNSEQKTTEWVCSYVQEYRSDSSPWRVITDNGPVLTFDMYNSAMHLFSDPDYHETGTGFGGDYEFIIVDAPEDASYMMLKGKKRGTYNLLTPVEEGVEYEAYLADVRNFQSTMFSESSPTGALLVMGDSIYSMDDAGLGLPSIYPLGKDKVAFESFYPFLITKRGDDYYLRFRDVLTKGEASAQEFRYNPEKDIFEGVNADDCYIRGDSIGRFFDNSLFQSGFRWEWNDESPMSESFAQLYNQALEGFKDVLKFNLLNMCFRVNSDVFTFRMQYKNGRNTQNVDFDFAMERKADRVTLHFLADHATSATNARNKVEAVQTLVDLMQTDWDVFGGQTQFDLRLLRFVKADDPNMWFQMTMTK